jgi:hypothetical protein
MAVKEFILKMMESTDVKGSKERFLDQKSMHAYTKSTTFEGRDNI